MNAIKSHNINRISCPSPHTFLLTALLSATILRIESVLGYVLATCLQNLPVLAEGGLTRLPASPHDPYRAMSCLRSLSSLMLDCSGGGETVGMHAIMTSTTCWANNTPYLTSLAWCMYEQRSKHISIPNSKLETFWERRSASQRYCSGCPTCLSSAGCRSFHVQKRPLLRPPGTHCSHHTRRTAPRHSH
jgi:hypothetical protein